ncbi:hypothetical protein Pse7367_1369 [Thalassoporum mexicanum PCC 7367]|uniref:hypothetical protein n=1 Tax=Thalassoporum mexicanum TaxID=3457544 RepID=UPI00029F9BD2|nr:hypothetical protein [Pseudanabaena sp. PCC 7367]AFY69661.1 hypothetical protein Pse7367_1369 [Pseudanabaena sp. PCC 7367]
MLRPKSSLTGLIVISGFAICLSLISCQDQSIEKKAERYLRSQLLMPDNVLIELQTKTEQRLNQSDLCQTEPADRNGYQLLFAAEGIGYVVHTSQDASEIELCGSQDLQAKDYLNYVGAGYEVEYPADWLIRDIGLEPDGTNRVYFSPLLPPDLKNGYILLEKFPGDAIDLDAEQLRSPNFDLPEDLESIENNDSSQESLNSSESDSTYDLTEIERGDLRTLPLVVSPELVETIKYQASPNQTSPDSLPLQVEVLLISADTFVYKIQFFYHDTSALTNEMIQQFGQGFQIIN